MSQSLIGSLRREAREAPSSGIVEVFNYGRGRPGLIPLWVGEGDLATPDFICEAAWLAREIGAPVRVQWTREDDLRNSYYHTVAAHRIEGQAALAALWHGAGPVEPVVAVPFAQARAGDFGTDR